MKLKFLLIVTLLVISFVTEEMYSQSFETGKIAITMNSYGRVRVIKETLAGTQQIDRSSFLAGVNENIVFSYKLSAEPEDTVKNVENPLLSDYEISGSVNNTYDTTGGSPDFLVHHNVYGWSGEGYVLVKFTVKNRETSTQNAVLGMEIIARIDGSYGLETVKYLPDSKIISMFRLPASTFVGYKLLSHDMTNLKMIEWYEGYNDVNSDLFGWLTYGQIDTLLDSGGDGAVTFFSKDSVTIPVDGEEVFWVGISIGANEAEMVSNMDLAKVKYETITDIVDEYSGSIPNLYKLEQNYPNPFNPATTIQFQIPKTEYVTLKVYDVLGNEVANPVNQILTAGNHSVQFNANSLTSGMYFYRITAGSYSEVKKMTLIK
ncbi:MAG TPA: T9SS type A sorting domain-containing protein [Ignavibacteriaceae bacterium]|nr:T9SS type A sorting domain-containing protein [Ignavibacteriaceae bacterium]